MSLNRETEVKHLEEADKHILQAQTRIAKQEEVVATLHRHGHDATEGERLLKRFKETLDTMLEHRREISDVLAKIDAGLF